MGILNTDEIILILYKFIWKLEIKESMFSSAYEVKITFVENLTRPLNETLNAIIGSDFLCKNIQYNINLNSVICKMDNAA